MKYNITLNQPLMIENKLNISQWCILDVISVAPIWCEAVQKDNEVYYWVARQKISDELKALDLKSDTIYRYIKQLVELGFINHIKDGKKDLIKLTQKGKSLFVSMSEKNPNHYVGKKSELNSEKNPTYNNTNLINKTNNKYDIFLDYLKSKCKYKSKVTKTKDGSKLFNSIQDKRQLAIDYIKHQEEKNEFAVRISKFMEDYNTVYKDKTNSNIDDKEWSDGVTRCDPNEYR